jgi:hypothetical protein
MNDLDRASTFVIRNARLIDRRRFALITGRGTADAVLAALLGYRNEDGGYGWALEPDLRTPESRPVGALHAFEVFAEIGGGEAAVDLCDWLDSVTLPIAAPAGSAPWWIQADPTVPSLLLTSAIAEAAHQVARHDRSVREHAWLRRATEYCRRQITALEKPGSSLEFRSVLGLLDALHDTWPEAPEELRRLAAHLPADGILAVEGGIDDEKMYPLDFSPHPGRPVRGLLAPRSDRIRPEAPGRSAAEGRRLDRRLRHPDGGECRRMARVRHRGRREDIPRPLR